MFGIKFSRKPKTQGMSNRCEMAYNCSAPVVGKAMFTAPCGEHGNLANVCFEHAAMLTPTAKMPSNCEVCGAPGFAGMSLVSI